MDLEHELLEEMYNDSVNNEGKENLFHNYIQNTVD
jgi:hypothetical protein